MWLVTGNVSSKNPPEIISLFISFPARRKSFKLNMSIAELYLNIILIELRHCSLFWLEPWALAREIENYEKGGKFISDAELRKEFTKLRHSARYLVSALLLWLLPSASSCINSRISFLALFARFHCNLQLNTVIIWTSSSTSSCCSDFSVLSIISISQL